MQVFELDSQARLEGSGEKQLNKTEVAFRLNETCYYEISWDESSNSVIIRKAGFHDDKIIISVGAANKISIQ